MKLNAENVLNNPTVKCCMHAQVVSVSRPLFHETLLCADYSVGNLVYRFFSVFLFHVLCCNYIFNEKVCFIIVQLDKINKKNPRLVCVIFRTFSTCLKQ